MLDSFRDCAVITAKNLSVGLCSPGPEYSPRSSLLGTGARVPPHCSLSSRDWKRTKTATPLAAGHKVRTAIVKSTASPSRISSCKIRKKGNIGSGRTCADCKQEMSQLMCGHPHDCPKLWAYASEPTFLMVHCHWKPMQNHDSKLLKFDFNWTKISKPSSVRTSAKNLRTKTVMTIAIARTHDLLAS